MKKKALSTLLAVGLVLSMAGCQQKAEVKEPSKTEEAPVTEKEEPAPEPEPETVAEESEAAPETEAEKKEMEVSTIGFVAPDMGYRIENHESEKYDETDPDVLLYTVDYDTLTITKEGLDPLKEAVASMNGANEELVLHSELWETIDSDYQEMKDFWNPYSLSRKLSVTRFDDRVLSIKETISSFTGGAHGSGGLMGVTYNAETGEELSLDAVSSDPAALKSFSSQFIKDYVNKVYNSDPDGMGTFEDWEPEVDNFLEGPDWLLNDYGLEYMIGAYVLGPYAMGDVEVTIPYSKLKGLLKEEYLRDTSTFTYQFTFGEEVTVDDSGNTLSAKYKVDQDDYLGNLTLQFGEEAIVAAQDVDMASNPWVVKEADGRIFIVTETGVYSEDMVYTHMLFQLVNGGFTKLDEMEERAVTNSAEVEAIVEGMT